MTTRTSDNAEQTTTVKKPKRLNLRRKRCWVLIALLLYTLLGFFVISAIIKTTLVNLIEEELGRGIHIQAVLFNPYQLSLRIQQLEVRDTDDATLLSFDELFVNFQLSSLFRWAWTFQEVHLDNAYIFYERFDVLDSRLSRLLADATKNKPAPEEVTEEKAGGIPRLLIHDLLLNGGSVDLRDNVPETVVDMHFGPIDIAIKELNTLPDKYGQKIVNIILPNEANLKWQGDFSLMPLDLQGELELNNTNLAVAAAYLKPTLPVEAIDARLSSRLQYRVKLDDNGDIGLDIDNLDIELDEIAITGLSPSKKFFSLKQLALLGGTVHYPEQRVEFTTLRVSEPQVDVWRKIDGSLSVSDLMAASNNENSDEFREEVAAEQSAEIPTSNEQNKPWQLDLKELILDAGRFNFVDHSIRPVAEISLADLSVKATDIINQEDAEIPFAIGANLTAGGELSLNGVVQILPNFSFSAKTAIRDIPLSVAQPYVQQFSRIQLTKGALNSDLSLNISDKKPLTLSGSLQIPDLEIKDTVESKRLLAWKKLAIEKMNLDLDNNKLELSPVQLDELFGRIIIYKDKRTNLSNLVIAGDQSSAQKQSNKSTDDGGFDVVIGGVRVKQGGMYFSDQSLPLPFATHIKGLNGTVSTIATNSNQPASIKLEGQVDDYGLSRINGAIDLLDPVHRTDISVQFRNLLMSNLSPYTVEFAGRKIAEGKLDLDLRYDITKSQLNANNKVVISDLELGDKVDHPDATNLPLGLAVALLKDTNGIIDISLPIEGNIDDPKFKIGGIIWQTFAGLIVKAVTSPFRLLGGLIGIESDDLGKFQFLAGRADLTPPEMEKIAQLKQALQQRPKLAVEIGGAVDPDIDTPALKYSALRNELILRSGDKTGELEDADILDERFFKPLKSLFVERFPDVSLKSVHKVPPADDPEGRPVLDELAYAADLRDRLLESVEVSDADLTALAQARAETIKAAFLADEFDTSRIAMVEPETVESDDGQWVQFELGVAPK